MKNLYSNEILGITTSNANRANERASFANTQARIGRGHRNDYDRRKTIIAAWICIMAGSPVILDTILFLVFAVAEIIYSWEMYREFLGAFFGDPHWSIVLLLGLVIVASAAFVSHLLSKTLSSNLFDLEVFNFQFITKNNTILESEAREYITKDRKMDFIKGLIGMILLLCVVAFISWQRTFLMHEVTGDDYSLIQKLFPVIIVLLEVLTGIYLGLYLIPLLVYTLKKRKSKEKLMNCVELCSKDDRIVTALLVAARDNNESFTMTKELSDSLYRIKNRSSNSINYIDEINLKQISVQVIGRNNLPLANVLVVGSVITENAKSSSITNVTGNCVLFWDGPDDFIESIELNNSVTKEGPFLMNGQYVLSFDDALLISA